MLQIKVKKDKEIKHTTKQTILHATSSGERNIRKGVEIFIVHPSLCTVITAFLLVAFRYFLLCEATEEVKHFSFRCIASAMKHDRKYFLDMRSCRPLCK